MTRLVIAPHVDDDVLGCGGSLDAQTVTLYCGVDDHHVVSARGRFAEAAEVIRITGGRMVWPLRPTFRPGPGSSILVEEGLDPDRVLTHGADQVVNHYEIPPLIALFEQYIKDLEPDEVLIPWPSYNQDHRAVYEAALVALRPHDVIPMVPRVLVYEQPHVAIWDHAHPDSGFRPHYFRPIDIERKVALYRAMPSQVRAFRSVETIRSMAQLRGAAVGLEAAEAFRVLRWIEGARA